MKAMQRMIFTALLAVLTWPCSYILFLFTEHVLGGRIFLLEFLGEYGMTSNESSYLLNPIVIALFLVCVANGCIKLLRRVRTLLWIFFIGAGLGWLGLTLNANAWPYVGIEVTLTLMFIGACFIPLSLFALRVWEWTEAGDTAVKKK